MKHLSILVAFIAIAQTTFAQINNAKGSIVGNGQFVKEQRTIDKPFDRLSADYAVKVRITQGDPTKAEVEAESNVLPYLIIEEKGGELKVGLSRKAQFKDIKEVTVTIHSSKLKEIKATTACSITSDLPIEADQLTISLNEACTVTAPIAVQTLKIDLEAASNVTLRGKATEADIKLEAASKVEAEKLTIARATLTVNAASNARVHVTETLSASADGVSTLRYSGSPTVKSQQTSGLSKIRRL